MRPRVQYTIKIQYFILICQKNEIKKYHLSPSSAFASAYTFFCIFILKMKQHLLFFVFKYFIFGENGHEWMNLNQPKMLLWDPKYFSIFPKITPFTLSCNSPDNSTNKN